MNIVPPALAKLIESLGRFPGIGKKTATRLALYLLRRPPGEALALARDLAGLHEAITLCRECFIFSEEDICPICSDSKRNSHLICVVEEPADMLAIEKCGAFKGRYHILHGALSPMDGVGPEEIRADVLLSRIHAQRVEEVLVATSSTVPGEATAAFLMDMLKGESVSVSRLAYGIPMGMDIKYADEVTLCRAIEARRRNV